MNRTMQKWYAWLLLFIFLAVIGSGCSSMRHTMGLEEEPPPPPAPKYYDFSDVLIPPELSVDLKESVIYESGGMKAGLLFFTGRVEANSLIRFFRTYLPRDGWELVSSARFARLLLNFSKPDKTCQIVVRDKALTTEVEVWVHPLKPPEGQ